MNFEFRFAEFGAEVNDLNAPAALDSRTARDAHWCATSFKFREADNLIPEF
jgi:hypothetical protein